MFDESDGADTKQMSFSEKFANMIDSTSLYWKPRWALAGIVLMLYILRILIWPSFYVVTYALSIFLLNLLISFLSPPTDPITQGPILPTADNDEYRPFVRKLPEFKFWKLTMGATLVSGFITCFSIFDVPVYWEILLIYFLLLFGFTMKEQITHMLKHKYVPINFGKRRYTPTVL